MSTPKPQLHSELDPKRLDEAMRNSLNCINELDVHPGWQENMQFCGVLYSYAYMRHVSILGEGSVLLNKLDAGHAHMGHSSTILLDSKTKVDDKSKVEAAIQKSSAAPLHEHAISGPKMLPIYLMQACHIFIGLRNWYSHPYLHPVADKPIEINYGSGRQLQKYPIEEFAAYDCLPGGMQIIQCLQDIAASQRGKQFYVQYQPAEGFANLKLLEEYCLNNLGAALGNLQAIEAIDAEGKACAEFSETMPSSLPSMRVNAIEMGIIRVMNSYLNVTRAIKSHPRVKEIMQDIMTQCGPTVAALTGYEAVRTELCHNFGSISGERLKDFMGSLEGYSKDIGEMCKILPGILTKYAPQAVTPAPNGQAPILPPSLAGTMASVNAAFSGLPNSAPNTGSLAGTAPAPLIVTAYSASSQAAALHSTQSLAPSTLQPPSVGQPPPQPNKPPPGLGGSK